MPSKKEFNDPSLEDTENPKIKYRFNHESGEHEFIEVEKDTLREIGIIVIISIAVAIVLAPVFKVSYLNTLGSISLYLFTISGLVLFLGSIISLCQESPSIQYLAKGGNKEKVRIRTTSDLKIYTLAALILFVLSFAINYVNKLLYP